MSKINLLIVDDDEDDFILTKETIEDIVDFKTSITWIDQYDKAEQALRLNSFDLALIDYRLGKENGITLIKSTLDHGKNTPMIILTGKGDRNIDKEAMRQGAVDYLVKDEITPVIIERSIRYALRDAENLQIIRESESKFKQLFERSLDSIFISDCDHAILDVNRAMIDLLSYSHEEIIGLKMDVLCNDCEGFKQFEKLLLTESQIVDFELELVGRNKKKIDCQISAVARMDRNGNLIGYQGIIKDISLRKIAENELVLAERLSLTGKLARSIAHEIRNPLTNLSLATEQLKDELPANDETELFLGIIQRNAKRIDQLISELMDSSKSKELQKELMFY